MAVSVTVKRKAERVIADMIRQSPGISSSLPIVPVDGDSRVATNRVAVDIEFAEKQKDGPGGYDAELAVTLTMMKGPLVTPYFDIYMRAIELALTKPPAATPEGLDDFEYMRIDDIESGETDNSGKIRSGVLNARMRIKPIHTQIGVALDDNGEPITDDQGYPIETRPEDEGEIVGVLLDDQGNPILDDLGEQIQTVP